MDHGVRCRTAHEALHGICIAWLCCVAVSSPPACITAVVQISPPRDSISHLLPSALPQGTSMRCTTPWAHAHAHAHTHTHVSRPRPSSTARRHPRPRVRVGMGMGMHGVRMGPTCPLLHALLHALLLALPLALPLALLVATY